MIEIKHRHTGRVLFSSGYMTEKEMVEAAVKECVDLSGASLCNIRLRDADLRGANLKGADFRNADLIYADLRGANLSNANLYNADLLSQTCPTSLLVVHACATQT